MAPFWLTGTDYQLTPSATDQPLMVCDGIILQHDFFVMAYSWLFYYVDWLCNVVEVNIFVRELMPTSVHKFFISSWAMSLHGSLLLQFLRIAIFWQVIFHKVGSVVGYVVITANLLLTHTHSLNNFDSWSALIVDLTLTRISWYM